MDDRTDRSPEIGRHSRSALSHVPKNKMVRMEFVAGARVPYLISIFLNEAADSQTKFFVSSDRPIHGIQSPWRFKFINLFPFNSLKVGAFITGRSCHYCCCSYIPW